MADHPDPTTGALGTIYSGLGDMTLGEDYYGREILAEIEVQTTVLKEVSAEIGVGENKARTAPTAISVSRPPSRTIPTVIATSFTRDRTVPTTIATEFRREHTVPTVIATMRTQSRVVPTYIAVDRDSSPALLAPRRSGLMRLILDSLSPLYDTDPEATTMLTINPPAAAVSGTPWRVSGNLFEIVGLPNVAAITPIADDRAAVPGRTDAVYLGIPDLETASPASGTVNPLSGVPAYTRDLRTLPLATLAAELTAAGYPAVAAPEYADLAATTLIDGRGDASVALGGLVPGFTSVLWRVLRAVALGLELTQDDLAALAAQLDLRRAVGIWLDWWGVLYRVPRLAPEDDAQYRKRIIWSVTRPRSNNTAIEALLRDLFGQNIYVYDRHPIGISKSGVHDQAAIDFTFSPTATLKGSYFPGYPPRFVVAVPQTMDDALVTRIGEVVETLRAAGVRYEVARYSDTPHVIQAEIEIGGQLVAAMLADNPVSLWPLKEATGATVATDLQGVSNGAYTGGTTPGSPAITADGGTATRFFGPTEPTVAIPNTAAYDAISAAISFELWVQFSSAPESSDVQGLFFFPEGSANGVLANATGFRFQLDISGEGTTNVTVPMTIVPGTRYHIVGTYDGAAMRLYVNDILGNTTLVSGAVIVPGADNVTIGRTNPTTLDTFLNGYASHVAVYAHGLLAARVSAHYAAGVIV